MSRPQPPPAPFALMAAAVGTFVALSGPAASARADHSSPDSAVSHPKRHSVCWNAKPAAECGGFIIFDFGYHIRLDDSDPAGAGDKGHVSLDAGYARNTSPRDAFGGSFYLATGSEHARVGVRGRWRRWLSRSTAVDISPGVIVYGSEDAFYNYKAPGAVLGATLAWKSLGVTVEAEHSRYDSYTVDGVPSATPPTTSDTTWRAGLRLGSTSGFIASAALVTLFIVTFAATAE